MKKIVIIGFLIIGLISPTAMQCNNTKLCLGIGALLTGAVSYTFFKESAKQRGLLEDHDALAGQFNRAKAKIDDLSTRLAQQSQSHGADIKMIQESRAIKQAIHDSYYDHWTYINSNPTLDIVFTPLRGTAISSVAHDACRNQQEAASETSSAGERQAHAHSAYGLLTGWLKRVKEEADKVNTELEERARVLQARRTLASRWGTGFGIACAAALIKLHYWPTARA